MLLLGPSRIVNVYVCLILFTYIHANAESIMLASYPVMFGNKFIRVCLYRIEL